MLIQAFFNEFLHIFVFKNITFYITSGAILRDVRIRITNFLSGYKDLKLKTGIVLFCIIDYFFSSWFTSNNLVKITKKLGKNWTEVFMTRFQLHFILRNNFFKYKKNQKILICQDYLRDSFLFLF